MDIEKKHFTCVIQTISEDPGYAKEKEIALEGLGEAYLGSSMLKEAIRTFEQLSNSATGVVKLRSLRRAMSGIMAM
jgi:hypothetical protein